MQLFYYGRVIRIYIHMQQHVFENWNVPPQFVLNISNVSITNSLTFKQLSHRFSKIILFLNDSSWNSTIVHHKCHIVGWIWSNTMKVSSTLWILMAWCISTRTSVATVLSTHPCVSSYLWINGFAAGHPGIILGMGSETPLQCNVVSHRLSPYQEWSLRLPQGQTSSMQAINWI